MREAQHRLHHRAFDARLGPQRAHLAQHVVERRGDHSSFAQAEAHAADVGLVRDVGRVDLEHDREADLARRGDGAGRASRGDDGARHRAGRTRRAAPCASCSVSSARLSRSAASRIATAAARSAGARSPARAAAAGASQQLRLVAPVRAEEREGLDRVLGRVEVRRCRAPRGTRGSRLGLMSPSQAASTGLRASRPRPATSARAAASGSVTATGEYIASSASTPGSASAAAVASAKRCAGASPMMSIGLPCDHCAGSLRSARAMCPAQAVGERQRRSPPRCRRPSRRGRRRW